MSNNGRLVSIVSFVITVAAFLVLASVAIVWASGLSIDVKSRKVSQTGIISVTETLKTAQIYLNDSLVSSETPHDIRGLTAGDYHLEVVKTGYQSCDKNYKLAEGEAIAIEPAMVATNPLTIVVSESGAPNYQERSNFDFGLSFLSGELLDYGDLISRFSSDIVQAHRFTNYYTYQSGSDLHFLDLGCGTDQIIYSSTSTEKIKYIQRTNAWIIYIYEADTIKKLDLRTPTEASASL